MTNAFATLCQRIQAIPTVQRIGRVIHVDGEAVQVTGLQDHARLGDSVQLRNDTGVLDGEVLGLSADSIRVIPDQRPDMIRLGDQVTLLGARQIAPSSAWLGRVVDANGVPLDGGAPIVQSAPRPILSAPPPAINRGGFGPQLRTPYAVLNTVLPIARGQRIGLFAGSGVGKSTLLGDLAKGLDAEVNVIALIGERGREVNEFLSQTLGEVGLAKSVVVVATSDQSAALRRRAAYTAMTVAEALRDEGKSVLFLADSLTRFAEAHRQISAASGENIGPSGYPASTSNQIMQLCERSGPGVGYQGEITAVYSVLVAGSDMEEPIADMTRGVLDGHLVLERKIAERGRFPAIDLSRSVSRSVFHLLSKERREIVAHCRELIGSFEASEIMIKAGLYSAGSDAVLDKAVRLWPSLDGFIGATSNIGVDESFDDLSEILEISEKTSATDQG